MLWLPESPRWLINQGEHELARQILRRIRHPDEVPGELRYDLSQHHGLEGSWTEVLAPEFRPALILGIGLAMFQQITGINTIIYYAPTIIPIGGIRFGGALIQSGHGLTWEQSRDDDHRFSAPCGPHRPAAAVANRHLRGNTASLITLGWLFRARDFPAASSLAVASVMFYVASFAIGLGPIFWLLISEIYPLRIRGVAMGLATMSNWAFNLLVALTFLILLNSLSPAYTFWMYSAR